jgi:hypothetical protein
MIKDLIKNMSAKDKHKEKAKALAKVKLTKVGKYEIESISEENGLLKVIVKGQGNRKPCYFKDPPIIVPAGTKRIEIIDDKEIEIDNYKEDHEESLKQILLQTLELKNV